MFSKGKKFQKDFHQLSLDSIQYILPVTRELVIDAFIKLRIYRFYFLEKDSYRKMHNV